MLSSNNTKTINGEKDDIINENIISNEFKYEFYIEDNKLNFKHKYDKGKFYNLEFAYYILNKGRVIEKIWYSNDSSICYQLEVNGEYSLQYYIRQDKKTILKKTNTINYIYNAEKSLMDIKTIDIHGSCVSRDIFNVISDEKVEFNKYIARQSIFSVCNEPFEQYDDNKIELTSNFQKRMLECDAKKLLFEELKNSNSEYLLIDLIDTVRFPLSKYENCMLTHSSEFANSGLNNHYKFETIKPLGFSNQYWKDEFHQYIEKINEVYSEDKIIIHCAYFKNVYIDEKGQKKNFDMKQLMKNYIYNIYLNKYYNYLKLSLPKSKIIDICKNKNYNAYSGHHFGLAPFHYEDKYYLDALNIIDQL